MNWTRLINRWKGRPAAHEEDLDAELAFHQKMKERDLLARGMSDEEARQGARRGMGNLTLVREEAYEAWTMRWLSDSIRDLRHGARTLAAQPGFTLAAVLALVLGIGVNAILFNVYNAFVLAPWAIRDARQTVQVLAERSGRWSGFSWPHFRYLREHTQSLAGLAAFSSLGVQVNRGDTGWRANAVPVSENYFELIGTGFAAGRGFSPQAGDLRDPAPEIVLHFDTWMTRFGGDQAVVGEWLELGGHKLQVVGVSAPGFSGPTTNIPQMWIPGPWRDTLDPSLKTIDNPNSCCISVIGRLKAGVGRAGAQAELNTLTAQFLASVKRQPSRVLLTDPSFLANPTSYSRASAIFLAMGVASLLILLLACANVANLQLARAIARRREIAVRLSLGASRGRILRQLMAESLVVSGIAGAASVAISAWAPAWIVRMVAGPGESLTFQFSNDGRVLAFILLATFLAALLFGLAPAWGAVRDGTATGLREGGRATSTSRMRSVLLAAQVALCAILLSGTALLVRALDRVRHLDAGFQYDRVIVMSPNLDASGVSDEQARGLLVPLVDRISRLPGVESVANANVIPFGNSFTGTSVPDPRTKERVNLGFNEVSANFFEILRIPLVSGRSFTSSDESRMDTAIVNEATAERLWPGESPLGKTLGLSRQLQVIGVVRNFGTRGFGSERQLYAWTASKGTRGSRLLIRHSGDAGPLLIELPKHARDLDRRFLASAAPYSETMANAFRSADLSAAIAGVLGSLALLLACVGIYGVAAYNVSQRTREVGVRMALGARPRAILAMILRQNLRTVVVGAAVGIAGAIGFGRLLTSLLFGVKPTDPLAMLVTITLLFAASAMATWGPAHRAAHIDPAITLRHE